MTDDLSRAKILAIAREMFESNGITNGRKWDDWPLHGADPRPLWIKAAERAHAAATRVREERGFVVVPREPTKAMLSAGGDAGGYDGYWQHDNTADVFRAMLAASQQRTAGE